MAIPSPPVESNLTAPPNVGAVIKIEACPATMVAVSSPNTRNVVTVQNFSPWSEFLLTQETASFKELSVREEEGILYEATLEWISPNVCPAHFVSAHAWIGKPLVLRFTAASGVVLLLGDSLHPVYIDLEREIPALYKDLNAQKFKVKFRNTHPACFVA